MPHILHIHSAPFPAATITHVKTLTVTVFVGFTAVSVVVAKLLLLPLGRRHLSCMSFPPLGAPVLEPDLQIEEKEKKWMSTLLQLMYPNAIKKFLKSHFAVQHFISLYHV